MIVHPAIRRRRPGEEWLDDRIPDAGESRQAIFVLFLVTVVTLALVHLFPGGPMRALLGQRATAELVAYYNQLYGFDKPFYEQYVKWVGQMLQGNLGFSDKLNNSVASLISNDLPKTIILVLLGTIVSLLFGIPLGVYQAVRATAPPTTC